MQFILFVMQQWKAYTHDLEELYNTCLNSIKFVTAFMFLHFAGTDIGEVFIERYR